MNKVIFSRGRRIHLLNLIGEKEYGLLLTLTYGLEKIDGICTFRETVREILQLRELHKQMKRF